MTISLIQLQNNRRRMTLYLSFTASSAHDLQLSSDKKGKQKDTDMRKSRFKKWVITVIVVLQNGKKCQSYIREF